MASRAGLFHYPPTKKRFQRDPGEAHWRTVSDVSNLASRGFQFSFCGVRRTIPKSVWAEIHTAYASGIGLREIARNMGLPEGTVLARAKREGWTRQIESSKALAKRGDAPLAVTPVEAVAMSMQQRGERHVERMAGVSERGVDHIETMDGPEILKSVDRIDKLDKLGRRTFGLDDSQAQDQQPFINVQILNS
jgi:hypothetical protein